MLSQSTVSICREHLNKELKNIERILFDLRMAKHRISVLDPNMRIGYNRRVFLEIDNRIKRQKDRRNKVEAAIRDLKACVWTGNLKELPQCESVSIKSSPDFFRAWPFLHLPK